jgi:hypothetical protein
MLTSPDRVYLFKTLPETLREEYGNASVEEAVRVTKKYAETSGGTYAAVEKYLRAMVTHYAGMKLRVPKSRITI